MKKVIFLLLAAVAFCGITQKVNAQTRPRIPCPCTNHSNYHVPPVVKHFLDNHPKVKKRVIIYIKNHCPAPAMPSSSTATLSRSTAGIKMSWPAAPPPPSVPAISSF